MENFVENKTMPNENNKKISFTGKVLIGASGLVAVGISVVCFPFISPAFRRFTLPFIPATDKQLRNILSVLPKNPVKNNRLLDIGSGDGRIVIQAAKHGFKSDGVELNYWLVLYSRLASLRSGTSKNTKFFRKDLWKYPLDSYNYCVIFGVEEMMIKLEEKFDKELKKGSTVIACRFPLPNKSPTRVLSDGDVDTVWIYDYK
ncbi:ATP synthase subunit C lysine N-methyltransferase [Chironomus tepperi]|uniref:ATP synthase subunit C lysine N-methyltransferase n=1 Tax=Chironomus tepperi TaxID=113505 RepID=UPI00391F871C